MIFTTSEVLERLELMPNDRLLAIVNPAFDEGEAELHKNPTAPDRKSFAALLRALTDEWPPRRDVDTPEHIREANSR